VTEVFKGRVASDPLTRPFVSNECGDDLFLFSDVGDRVVIAIGLQRGERISDGPRLGHP